MLSLNYNHIVQETTRLLFHKTPYLDSTWVRGYNSNIQGAFLTMWFSMKNVPWHEQVIEFCASLADQLEHYSIACEHEHSNCVLLAWVVKFLKIAEKFKKIEDKDFVVNNRGQLMQYVKTG